MSSVADDAGSETGVPSADATDTATAPRDAVDDATDTNLSAVDPNHRPAVPAGALSVVAALVALAAISSTADQRVAVAVELVGLAVVAGGFVLSRRGSPLGWPVALGGGLVVAVAVVLAVELPTRIVHRIELVPGMVGLAVLVTGLLPVRSGWERFLVVVGTGLLFGSVATSGVLQSSSFPALLVGGVAAVVAWDLAEQAVSLGRQVGRGSRTLRATLPHAAGTVGFSAVTVLVGVVVLRVGVAGLPLEGLLLLLVAGFALGAALRQ